MKEIKKAETAHDRREMFLEIHGKSRLIEIRLLYLLWKDDDYIELGFDSFKDFVTSPRGAGGLDISREWAVELIQTYETYVVKLKQKESLLIEASPRKLYYLKDEATPENIEEIISKAKEMTLSDLMKERNHVNEATCLHENREGFTRCINCKTWFKNEPCA